MQTNQHLLLTHTGPRMKSRKTRVAPMFHHAAHPTTAASIPILKDLAKPRRATKSMNLMKSERRHPRTTRNPPQNVTLRISTKITATRSKKIP